MTKNIRVVDDSGKDYGTTYLRRAKGLVKTGRARFTGENKICLARPPNQSLEDYTMGDVYTQGTKDVEAAAPASTENGPELTGLTINDVLSRIDRIMSDSEHIKAAVKTLGETIVPEHSGGPAPVPPDIANQSRADAIAEVVKNREETNRKILGLLEKMYDDLEARAAPDRSSVKQHRNVREFEGMLKMLRDAGVNMSHDDLLGAIANALGMALIR